MWPDERISKMSHLNPNDYRGMNPNNPDHQNNPIAPLPNHSGGSHSSSSSTSSHQFHDDLANPGALIAAGKAPRSGPIDLTRLSQQELMQRVRKLEADLLKLASDHNHMIREANHRIQVCN